MTYKFIMLLFFLGLAGQTSISVASKNETKGTRFFSLDNDILASSDDDYTNGFQTGWVSGYLDSYSDGPMPNFLAQRLDQLAVLGRGRQRFISHSVSHRIFTPGDTKTTQFVPGDIPYSGMLFGTMTAGAQDAKKMHAFSLHYGVAGPAALGEQVQNGFHSIIGSEKVNGWDNQIGNELLLNLNYEHRRRLAAFEFGNGVRADVLGQVGGAIGNLISMGTLGVGGRIGWGLQDDFAIPPQFFGDETIGSRPYTKGNSSRGFWLFALINGSAIGNAIFWDGNTFRDSPSVDYDTLIGRAYVGAVKRFEHWSFSFSIAKTTAPWENPKDKSTQTYGRFSLAYSY